MDAATKIQQAASFMAHNNLGSILITEQDKVIGLFTERDLLTRVVGANMNPNQHTLGEVCTRNLISIPHNSTCQNAIRLMQANNCRRLLVYRHDSLHGLVNIATVAHALAEHRGLKNIAVNLVGGITLTVVIAVIVMLIAIFPDMLNMAEQAMH
jgi:signal-transduction protein with cAMP-binding, CBS, and nucleotidyltransferase domain